MAQGYGVEERKVVRTLGLPQEGPEVRTLKVRLLSLPELCSNSRNKSNEIFLLLKLILFQRLI